jgi:hypothetical protein
MSHNNIVSLFTLKTTAIAAAGELLRLTKGKETTLFNALMLAEFLASKEHPSFALLVIKNTVANDAVLRESLTLAEVKLKLNMTAQELLFVAQSKDTANHEAITRSRNFCLLLAQFTELEMNRNPERVSCGNDC